ncbi:MAG: hypothetical protein LAT81_05700, partial [Oceanicaulis sp.]|nr:hypothetical protein [Oceanicaulis sp.]
QAGFKIYLPTSLLFDSISRFDLDILDMRGIIRINDFNHFSFDDWVGRLGSKLRQPVGAEFVKKYPKISESGHLEKISENFYYSKMAGALPSHPVIGLGEHEDALREAEQIHRASADENTIEEILCADAKVRTVKSFLSKIERNFDVTPVGKALATSYLRTHGIPIDDDFWLK